MPEITNREANQARLLILMTLVFGVIAGMYSDEAIHVQQAVPAGEAIISIDNPDQPTEIGIIQTGPYSPERVIINEATIEQLVCCPGIGAKTARLIVLERSYGKFADWRDLKDRIRCIGNTTIEKLKEAGVKIN